MNIIAHPLSKKDAKRILPFLDPLHLNSTDDTLWMTRLDRHTVVYLVNRRKAVWIETGKNSFPYVETAHLFSETLSQVWMDKGAENRVSQGADLMAPGITKIEEKQPSPTVIMRSQDESVVATGVWCANYRISLESGHGKVVSNLHFRGDKICKALKAL